MADSLAPFFLGAYGENNDFFEKTVLELLRDHVYWRRNFHPEDLPPIGTAEQYSREYLDGLARTRHELHQLTAALKRSVPFFHPRYLGHMVSDLLMPGLIAQLVTILYNPNNIVDEAGPVTVKLELEAGRQLATMMGYSVDPGQKPCALGHLTSGGTIANDESLWLARAARLFPLAVRDACEATACWPDAAVNARSDDWALLNWPNAEVLDLADRLSSWCAKNGDEGRAFFTALTHSRVEYAGLGAFTAKHPSVSQLALIVPATAHYSWQKAAKLLGLGAKNVIEVPTVQARLDMAEFDRVLEQCASQKRPVLAVVGVYGSTEFGTLDPIHELVARRGRAVGYWLHVDAAWGGYLPSLFRNEQGALRPHADVKAEFKYFPSERVYRATEALARADSITVDPHKLGFVSYGAGAFLVRDRRVLDLVQQEAPYVFTSNSADEQRYAKLGRFILEGSKPGAAAAACYVNHRVLPLENRHFGRLIARSIQTTEQLFDRLPTFASDLAPWARIAAPFEPDCNLLCFSVNPVRNRSLRAANAFGRQLFERMSVRADRPVQLREFFGSCTTVPLAHLGANELERVASMLGLDLSSPDDSGLFLLRHTLMNPWLQSAPGHGEPSYLEAYCHFVTETVKSLA